MGFRLLLAGTPKSAKTGALASLANAGYKLRYCNLDDNAEPLFKYSRPDAHKNIQVLDCIDEFRISKEGNVVSSGVQGLKSWSTILQAMDLWPIDKTKPKDWGARDVLVIDSLTELAKGLARRQRVVEGRELKRPTWSDFTRVQDQIDHLIVHMKSFLPKASLIVICHLQVIGPDLSAGDVEDENLAQEIIRQKLRGADIVPWKLAPISFGKAQSKTLAGHFTGTLYAKAVAGRGRKLITVPEDGFDAGVPVPNLPRELDLETGLAKVFDAVCGAGKPALGSKPAVGAIKR